MFQYGKETFIVCQKNSDLGSEKNDRNFGLPSVIYMT